MNTLRVIFVLFILTISVLSRSENVPSVSERKKLVLISFDGFRWDYINKYATPNFDALAQEGVYAKLGVRPVFATKTFPNHYSLATGLYEESHGIVNNKMYDPEFDAFFKMSNNETRWWDGGQPIWITARLQKLKSAVYYWPGSETRLDGVFANYFYVYNGSVPFKDRMDKLIEWLSEKDVDFVAAYFSEPDSAGHKYGVFSSKVGEKVREMDKLLGYFLEKIDKKGLKDSTNIIIVSDHGMANVTADEEHVIDLSEYLDMEKDVKLIPQIGPVTMILPHDGMKEIVYDKLSKVKRPFKVYKKEDIPERLHYKKHRRIMPIVVIAEEGYYIIHNRSKSFDKIGPGEHGYDNNLQSMKPIFFARGPDFKRNSVISTVFENVNLYPLMCRLLNIEPAPNNGTWKVFSDVLVNGSPLLKSFNYAYFIVTFLVQYLYYNKSL